MTFLIENGAKQKKSVLYMICEDAACGMEYLESKNCIHRYILHTDQSSPLS